MIIRRQEAAAFKFRSAGEVNFPCQYSSYFSRLKELREEGPAHGLCFSVFLSSRVKRSVPIILIWKVCESEFSIKRFQGLHPRGGGGYSGFQVTGMIEWSQKSRPKKSLGLPAKPQKIPGPKINPQKIPCRFCGP